MKGSRQEEESMGRVAGAMVQRRGHVAVIVAVQDSWSLAIKGGAPVLGRLRSVIQRL